MSEDTQPEINAPLTADEKQRLARIWNMADACMSELNADGDVAFLLCLVRKMELAAQDVAINQTRLIEINNGLKQKNTELERDKAKQANEIGKLRKLCWPNKAQDVRRTFSNEIISVNDITVDDVETIYNWHGSTMFRIPTEIFPTERRDEEPVPSRKIRLDDLMDAHAKYMIGKALAMKGSKECH